MLNFFSAWEPDKVLDPGVYWLYMAEMGFYLHSLYAMLYMETIRRDFKVMMAHHVLTIGLLLFSYFVRLQNQQTNKSTHTPIAFSISDFILWVCCC